MILQCRIMTLNVGYHIGVGFYHYKGKGFLQQVLGQHTTAGPYLQYLAVSIAQLQEFDDLPGDLLIF